MLGLPFLIDPRLVVRALDDLHEIAVATRSLPALEERLGDRLEAADRRLGEVVAAADDLDGRATEVLAAVGSLDGRATEVLLAVRGLLETAQRIDSVEDQVGELVRLAEELKTSLPVIDEVLETIRELSRAATTLAQGAEPLQGAAVRLGAIADRLPRAGRRREP